MADAIYTVILDVTDNGCIDTGWRLHQGDYGESQVVVKIVNNGVNLFDASLLPQITFKRSDGISIVGEMFVEDSTYKYNFVGNELEVPGFVLMDVKLIDSQGRTSTATSRFIVLPNTEGDTQEGSHTYINSGLVSELREEVQIAVESAATAVEEALVSEGWANGEQNGVPVEEGSPYYHNNSKYWSEQSNPTRFSSLSDVNFGTLEDGDIPVYDATSQKWVNEVGVSTDLITNTTGEFDTRTGGLLGSCKITLSPKQSGSGTPSPQNVRPITGHTSVEVGNVGKNKLPMTVSGIKSFNTSGTWSGNDYTLNDVTFTILTDNDGNVTGIKANGTASYVATLYVYGLNVSTLADIPITSDVICSTNVLGSSSTYRGVVWKQSGGEYIDDRTVSISQGDTLYGFGVRIHTGYNAQNLIFYPMIRLATETDATFEPYLGYTKTIALGQTVYGGSVDVVSGVVTVDKGYKDLGSLTWYKDTSKTFYAIVPDSKAGLQDMDCEVLEPYPYSYYMSQYSTYPDNIIARVDSTTSKYVYVKCTTYENGDATAFKTAMSGHKLVYVLETPITIQLTPQQIETLIGQNNVTVPLDGQSLDSLTYREVLAWDDVETAIDSATVTKADISAIGTDESGRTTASKAYAIGEHFYKDGKFGKTKVSVAQGATWTLNTNYEESTIADEFNKVSSSTATAVSGVTTVSSSLVLKFGRVAVFKCSFTLLNNVTSDNTITILKTPFSAYSSLLPVVTFNTSSPPYKSLDTIGWIDGTDVRIRDNLNAGSYQAYCVYICQ